MINNKLSFIFLVLFLTCFQARAQLSFRIDSLTCFCYGDDRYDYFRKNTLLSWENKALYHRGPDILIYGILKNEGEEPVILELYEFNNKDSLTFFRKLDLVLSYYYKKSYNFVFDPLIQYFGKF